MKFSHSASLEVIDLGRTDYVETTDYMTADFYHFDMDLLARISNCS